MAVDEQNRKKAAKGVSQFKSNLLFWSISLQHGLVDRLNILFLLKYTRIDSFDVKKSDALVGRV
jgi:hypothetical protein